MKKNLILLALLILIAFELFAQSGSNGFTSLTSLTPLPISTETSDKPQAKTWFNAGKWWAVLTNSGGTKIFRLDGTSWTDILTLSSTTSYKADCWVVGNVTHILLFRTAKKGAKLVSSAKLVSVEYDAATNKYKLWSQRSAIVSFTLENGTETATLAVDGGNRMWIATAGQTEIFVRWSDAPYSTWSAPIIIATGVKDDDICTITSLPGKIGVLWSNQTTKRYGFKTHINGDLPGSWSADEIPASQSALDIMGGMADDYLNVVAASNGTLYCAVKTSYGTAGQPTIALLIRRPAGTWDNLYPVTLNTGSRPIVLLNEAQGNLKIVYSSAETGGNILYQSTSTNSISFGPIQTLISGGGNLINYATSTHQTYSTDIVVLATNLSTNPIQAVGVIGNDVQDLVPPTVTSLNRQSPTTQNTSASSLTWRVTFSEAVTGVDLSDFAFTQVSGTVSGTLASVTPVGTGSTTFDVTANAVSGSGTVRLDVLAGGINDQAGNALANNYTGGQTYNIIANQPTLTSVGIASNNSNTALAKPGNQVTLSFTASEAINPPVVTIATHSVTATAGGSNSFTASYTMLGTDLAGTVPFTIDFTSTATGTAGAQVTATTNGSSVSFDPTAPTVTSLNRQSPTTQNTSASSLTWRVTFSEAVTGVDLADFAFTHVSGTVSGTLASVTPVGTGSTTFDVTANGVGGSGTVRLDVLAGGINDQAGNALVNNFTGGQTYNVQQITSDPIVLSVNRQLPTQETTNNITVTYRVIFSEKVTGVDAADFIITRLSGNVRGSLTKLSINAISPSATEAVKAVGTDGTTYDVSIRALAGSGTLRLDVKDAGTGIADVNNNALLGGFNSGETYIIQPNTSQGFLSFADIDPLPISALTKDNPQAKLWKYDGKWYTVLATSAGTKIFRLNGTSWVEESNISTTTSGRADCRVVGNVVHILLFRGTLDSYLISMEYDPVLQKYKPWTQRPAATVIRFETGGLTATFDIDGNGRMWIVSNNDGNVRVRWSDFPYSTSSYPITIATGIKAGDLNSIAALPGKIGVFWSNQNTQRFGFRTHTDGADPAIWSADEAPGAQGALAVGGGLGDEPQNLIVGSDGTLYCAIKTSYDTPGYPTIGLLVRRPSNVWDNLYTVTSSGEGNRPIIILNESLGTMKVFYNTHLVNLDGTRNGVILYRQSSISNISFGPPITIIGNSGNAGYFQYTNSTHQIYNSEIIILATNENEVPNQAASVIGYDDTPPSNPLTTRPTSGSVGVAQELFDNQKIDTKYVPQAYPNPFFNNTTIEFNVPRSGEYTITLCDINGIKTSVMKKGWAGAGLVNKTTLNCSNLSNGFYIATLETKDSRHTIKLIISR